MENKNKEILEQIKELVGQIKHLNLQKELDKLNTTEDTLEEWIGERCVVDDKAEEYIGYLYESYCNWSNEKEKSYLTKKEFSKALESKNYKNDKNFIFSGLRLK